MNNSNSCGGNDVGSSKRWLALLLGMVAFGAGGCASESDESSSDVTKLSKAQLGFSTFEGTAKAGSSPFTCHYSLTSYTVKNLSNAAKAAINAQTQWNAAKASPQCKGEGQQVNVFVGLVANTAGILSMIRSTSTWDADFSVKTRRNYALNFDIESGQVIRLANVVDAAGKRIVTDRCQAMAKAIASSGAPLELDGKECERALTVKSGDVTESFTLAPDGMHVDISNEVTHGETFLLPEEGFVIPWAALQGHLTKAAVMRLGE